MITLHKWCYEHQVQSVTSSEWTTMWCIYIMNILLLKKLKKIKSKEYIKTSLYKSPVWLSILRVRVLWPGTSLIWSSVLCTHICNGLLIFVDYFTYSTKESVVKFNHAFMCWKFVMNKILVSCILVLFCIIYVGPIYKYKMENVTSLWK